uniref:Uncharacterized protein n=1 Tax=Onchocerca volvulus TaxID=6282 RepID=A0A8R1TSF3_ONCVO
MLDVVIRMDNFLVYRSMKKDLDVSHTSSWYSNVDFRKGVNNQNLPLSDTQSILD